VGLQLTQHTRVRYVIHHELTWYLLSNKQMQLARPPSVSASPARHHVPSTADGGMPSTPHGRMPSTSHGGMPSTSHGGMPSTPHGQHIFGAFSSLAPDAGAGGPLDALTDIGADWQLNMPTDVSPGWQIDLPTDEGYGLPPDGQLDTEINNLLGPTSQDITAVCT
jgi:hypothetical protein